MRTREWMPIVVVTVALTAGGVTPAVRAQSGAPQAPSAAGDQTADVARLKDEIERLKSLVPDQSHIMKDIAYHFSNLWFAGRGPELAACRLLLERDPVTPALGRARPTRA